MFDPSNLQLFQKHVTGSFDGHLLLSCVQYPRGLEHQSQSCCALLLPVPARLPVKVAITAFRSAAELWPAQAVLLADSVGVASAAGRKGGQVGTTPRRHHESRVCGEGDLTQRLWASS